MQISQITESQPSGQDISQSPIQNCQKEPDKKLSHYNEHKKMTTMLNQAASKISTKLPTFKQSSAKYDVTKTRCMFILRLLQLQLFFERQKLDFDELFANFKALLQKKMSQNLSLIEILKGFEDFLDDHQGQSFHLQEFLSSKLFQNHQGCCQSLKLFLQLKLSTKKDQIFQQNARFRLTILSLKKKIKWQIKFIPFYEEAFEQTKMGYSCEGVKLMYMPWESKMKMSKKTENEIKKGMQMIKKYQRDTLNLKTNASISQRSTFNVLSL